MSFKLRFKRKRPVTPTSFELGSKSLAALDDHRGQASDGGRMNEQEM